MSDKEFVMFMALLMVSDPWPLDKECGRVLSRFADGEAKRRGWPDWQSAYHEMDYE